MSASITVRRLHRAVADLAAQQERADALAAELRAARREIREGRVRVADALAAMPPLPTTPADLARVGAVAQQGPRLETRARR